MTGSNLFVHWSSLDDLVPVLGLVERLAFISSRVVDMNTQSSL